MPSSSHAVIASARPWDGAKAGKCYNNVKEMTRQHGGEMCHGWALTDYGPHRCKGQHDPPPLYRRWLNHVVWRDDVGKLWEVTPNTEIGDKTRLQFRDTEFLPDAEATFEIRSDDEWFTRHTRYVAVRSEGEHVVELLNNAQHSAGDQRILFLKCALEALVHAGFRPTEWKVEVIGERTGSIWLITE